jgi:hypothetical protein
LITSTHNLLEFRDTLSTKERPRFKARILLVHEILLTEAQDAAGIAELPLLPPDAINRREWVKKRTYGKIDVRGLTGTEIAGRAFEAGSARSDLPLISLALQAYLGRTASRFYPV